MTQQAKEASLGTGSLSEKFNSYAAKKGSDNIVQLAAGGFNYRFDFALRQQVTWFAHDAGAVAISFGTTPFSQIDPEVLEAARDKLIALGGHPPELPPEAPTPQATTKGLRP